MSTVSTTIDDAPRERARPLAPDERREAILDAVVPLLRSHGRDVSSRQLAEAAGVAEGTLFRAFGDKEALVAAGVERIFDHLPLWTALRGVATTLPFEERLAAVIRLVREHFHEVVTAVVALGIKDRPHHGADRQEHHLADILAELFTGEADRFAVPLPVVADYLRMVAFASSLPMSAKLDDEALSHLISHGVLGRAGEERP